jgi:hypothetical protein
MEGGRQRICWPRIENLLYLAVPQSVVREAATGTARFSGAYAGRIQENVRLPDHGRRRRVTADPRRI